MRKKLYKDYYEVYENGDIVDIRTNKKVLPCLRNGNLFMYFFDGEKKKQLRMQRIVAECFIENPKNLKFVEFKDDNHLNISANNLRWAKKSGKRSTAKEISEQEKAKYDRGLWKEFPTFDEKYEVLKEGHIWNKLENKYVKEQIVNKYDNHLRVSINCKEMRKGILVHRLVAEKFVYNDDPLNKVQVNHLDGNPQNNHYTNLEWATPSRNTKHYYDIIKNKK